jgi:putative zinc finger protein
VDCGTYIEHFLSAHADGELTDDELRAAEEHVAGCAACRERLLEERALKQTLHQHLGALKTPAQIRERIRLALDREQVSESLPGPTPAVRGASRSKWLLPRVWVPGAIAALLVIGLTTLSTLSPPRHRAAQPDQALEEAFSTDSVPLFDQEVRHLQSFEKKFEPNVPSGTPADISDAYLGHKMPGYLWNFGPSGFQLAGGRLESLPNGDLVAYTFYRGDKGGILCSYEHFQGALPAGAIHETPQHSYYVYKGYSICVSKYPRGDFVCILITHRPIDEFMQTIADSSL